MDIKFMYRDYLGIGYFKFGFPGPFLRFVCDICE